MRILLSALVLLIMLTGCQQSSNTNIGILPDDEITKYKEIIKDGKVEIDGIFYDIQSVVKIINTYDDNENIIEKVTLNDNIETRIEFHYENNQLVEDRGYSNDELQFTTYYYYEDDLLISEKSVNKGGLEIHTEYSYGEKAKTQTHYNSHDNIAYIATEYLDDDGKVVKGVITTADGEITGTTTMYYENDLLVKSILEQGSETVKTFNFEYNNVGDKIMEYNIFSIDKESLLIAKFYDIEYNEKLLPKTVTIYQVQSKIAEEDIRKY